MAGKDGFIGKVPVGDHPEPAGRGHHRGGRGDERRAERGVGGAAGVEGRVHHHRIEARLGPEPGGIGPVEARPRIGEVAPRAVERRVIGAIGEDRLRQLRADLDAIQAEFDGTDGG